MIVFFSSVLIFETTHWKSRILIVFFNNLLLGQASDQQFTLGLTSYIFLKWLLIVRYVVILSSENINCYSSIINNR